MVKIDVSKDKLAGVHLWTCDSEDRDFRDNEFTSQVIDTEPADQISVIINYPVSGFRAFYIDLIYPDPNGDTYSKSTRMFVADSDKVL
jgi:PhoPQ-activated pathogenicity-related protein